MRVGDPKGWIGALERSAFKPSIGSPPLTPLSPSRFLDRRVPTRRCGGKGTPPPTPSGRGVHSILGSMAWLDPRGAPRPPIRPPWRGRRPSTLPALAALLAAALALA